MRKGGGEAIKIKERDTRMKKKNKTKNDKKKEIKKKTKKNKGKYFSSDDSKFSSGNPVMDYFVNGSIL